MTDPAPLAGNDGPGGASAWWLPAADGVRIRIVHWPAPEGARGTVLILPGRTEWAEKYALTAAALAARGWGAVAVDWRGQGLADRRLDDPRIGHVADFAEYQRDLRAVLDWAGPLGPMPWLAHSMGGCIALRALMDGLHPPAVAFSAPMWGLATTSWLRAAVALQARLSRLLGRDRSDTPTTGLPAMRFDRNPLTRDRPMFDRMKAQIAAEPRLALGGPSLAWTGAALAEMAALARRPSPAVPALVALGGAEKIVSPRAIAARLRRWPGAERADYAGAGHELLMERPAVRADLLRRAVALFDRYTG